MKKIYIYQNRPKITQRIKKGGFYNEKMLLNVLKLAFKLVHIQIPTKKALFHLILTDFNLLLIASHAKFIGPRYETIAQKHVLGSFLPATQCRGKF